MLSKVIINMLSGANKLIAGQLSHPVLFGVINKYIKRIKYTNDSLVINTRYLCTLTSISPLEKEIGTMPVFPNKKYEAIRLYYSTYYSSSDNNIRILGTGKNDRVTWNDLFNGLRTFLKKKNDRIFFTAILKNCIV